MMLQAALLLLGCALSRYLWEIDITIAAVVLGVTSFGVIFYIFIVIAGTASESCPYHTPAAHIFRHILRQLRDHPTSHSALVSFGLSRLFEVSWCCRWLVTWWSALRLPWYSISNIKNMLLFPLLLFVSLVHDAYLLGLFVVKPLVTFSRSLYRQLVGSHRMTHRWFSNISSLRTLTPGQQTTTMDLQCISWILQTSLDRAFHLSAFRHLISMPDLARFHPVLVVDCFNIFVGCISVGNGKVVIIQGFEQLAAASADGFFRTLYHLATMDPASSVLAHLQRRYNEVFPSEVDFTDLPFHPTMTKIHALAGRFGDPRDIRWHRHRLSIQEHIPFARRMAEAAQEKYQRSQPRKVPRWILRSALYFLYLGFLSSPSVVADCLTVIAIDLGCDVQCSAISDERCIRI